VTEYDAIADAYDGWAEVTDDIPFYVEEAGQVDQLVELGIGTGRVGVPMAQTGARVIGIDSSERMLEVCRRRAAEAGVAERMDLRPGDFRRPPVSERVPLVVAPFRSLSHLPTEDDRHETLVAIREMLIPGGRFVFDVATPEPEQVRSAGTRPATGASGMSERAEWDWEKRELRLSLAKTVGGEQEETRLLLSWLTRGDCCPDYFCRPDPKGGPGLCVPCLNQVCGGKTGVSCCPGFACFNGLCVPQFPPQ
jgi:SAM-dependent methyltransferase